MHVFITYMCNMATKQESGRPELDQCLFGWHGGAPGSTATKGLYDCWFNPEFGLLSVRSLTHLCNVSVGFRQVLHFPAPSPKNILVGGLDALNHT